MQVNKAKAKETFGLKDKQLRDLAFTKTSNQVLYKVDDVMQSTASC